MPPLPDIALSAELRFILNLGVTVLAALAGGAVAAARLGLPTVVGYLVAGIAIGPFTPGFVGDQEQITVLADIGVVLLLFALGVQFPCATSSQSGASPSEPACCRSPTSRSLVPPWRACSVSMPGAPSSSG